MGCDVAEQHGRAVEQHDHHVRVRPRDRLQSGDLVGRQVHVGAVASLGLVRGGRANQDDDRVGRARRLDGLGTEPVVVRRVADA
jgi:hypothetical protein